MGDLRDDPAAVYSWMTDDPLDGQCGESERDAWERYGFATLESCAEFDCAYALVRLAEERKAHAWTRLQLAECEETCGLLEQELEEYDK